MDFPLFLELPFEIRWAIYELCLPTRVIYSESREMRIFWKTLLSEEELALRHDVTRFTRTPVIARASPELYRDLRRHVVAPPDGGWVWSWCNFEDAGYIDPRPILFDPRSDVFYISPENFHVRDADEDFLDRSPYCMTRRQDVTLAIDQGGIDALQIWKILSDQCYLGRKSITIVLNETRLIKPAEWIASCGLFGIFGEERTVLVDPDDFERIDYFDRKLNGQGMMDGEALDYQDSVAPGGIRRYSSHGNLDLQTTWHEGAPLVSAEERAEVIAKDKEAVVRRLKYKWLAVNECFEFWNTDTFVPHEGWDRVYDENHPNAKFWTDKLPAFSFVVRVRVQDLEESARLSSAKKARERVDRLKCERARQAQQAQ